MEEIIIDGVDVSRCKYYRKDKNCNIWGIPCQMKEFCYFKILKQENAKLKETLEEISEIADKACRSGCRCIDKTDILSKINEVTNDK